MKNINKQFRNLITEIHNKDSSITIPLKNNYSTIEIDKYLKHLQDIYISKTYEKSISELINKLTIGKREILISNICLINSIVKKHNVTLENLNSMRPKDSQNPQK